MESLPLLLNYQKKWISDQSQLRIFVKSRRIGASWAEACASVLAAIEGKNTVYLSYGKEMTEGFIRDCEFFCKAFNHAVAPGAPIVDEQKQILGFQIRFPNGKTIKALSSKPRNLRSRQARVIVDEVAFCENVAEILKSALALLIWGGSLTLISTHNGIDNEFNALLEAIDRGEKTGWSVHRTDIHDAISDGLYKRICLMQNKEWSLDLQKKWLEQLFSDYGLDAAEELECVPFAAAAGKVFDTSKFITIDDVPIGGEEVRFWDLAATEKDLKGNDPCYTAGVKMRVVNGKIYVLDMIAVQQSAGAIDDLIKATAIADGKACRIAWEVEGGSAGKRDAYHITKLLLGFEAGGVRPQGDKVKRSKPFASQVNAGNVYLARGAWNNQYKKWLYAFPDGAYKDAVDASSGAFYCLTNVKSRPQVSGSWSSW